MLLDVFSRYIMAWHVAERESVTLTARLLEDAYLKQGVWPGRLTVHAHHGSPMISKIVTHRLADLGVTRTPSRPHVSNDNPSSEVQFKTLKYQPTFRNRFGCREDALTFRHHFVHSCNEEHYHSGLKLLTPGSFHHGSQHPGAPARPGPVQK